MTVRGRGNVTGELLALGSSFAFGLASVAIAKGVRTNSTESGLFLGAIATALLSGTAWALVSNQAPLGGGAVIWGAVGWFVASGLLATVGGRMTMFKSIEYAGVVRASTSRRVLPFLSALFGWIVFGERVSVIGGCGMFLIGVSFTLLYWDNRASLRISSDDPGQRAMVSYGLAFGLLSAFLYAVSYVARKLGLALTPDAYFGTLIGSLTAIVFYGGRSVLSDKYRAILHRTLRAPDPWQVLAALLISIGQITQFAALMFIGVGRLAFINSLEVYISAFLAVFVFRTEPVPRTPVFLAMLLASVGVVLIATPP